MSADALLKSVLASPDDDLPRLVYADWLDENGDPARAEFIRTQIELANLPDHDPRFRPLVDREHELLNEYEPAWMGDLARFPREWEWRRGFVDDVTVSFTALTIEEQTAALDTQPVTGCRIVPPAWDMEPTELVTVRTIHENYDYPWLNGLRRVDLSGWAYDVAVFEWLLNFPMLAGVVNWDFRNLQYHDELRRCFGYAAWVPHTTALAMNLGVESVGIMRSHFARGIVDVFGGSPLAKLIVADSRLHTTYLGWLLSAPFAGTLKHLDISDNPIAPDAYRAFRQCHPAMRLDKLDVSGTPLAGISLEPLLNCRSLEALTRLEMNGCGSARRNMEVLSRSAFWTQATELRAHSGTIPASTLEPLCHAAGPPALRTLDLADNYLRAEGVRLLCESTWAGSLTHLDLSRNYLDDEACEVLAKSGRFTNLRTLHLAGNNLHQEGSDGEQILDRGVVMLTESPSLGNLRVLTLSRTAITDATVDRVLNAPFWRLSGLGIGGCDLTPAAVRYLATSPRLRRLNWLDVSHNPRLRGQGLRPLAESPYLSRLCELDCGGIAMDDDVRAILRERLGPRFSH